MSAVIWCGIVAVWVFLLIPTWVRRSDLHWRRGPIGTAVVAVGPTDKSSGKAGRVSRRRLLRRSRDDLSIEVEAMAEQDAQFPAEAPVVAASAPRARVAAAPSSGRLGSSVRSTFGTGPKGSERKKPPLRVRRARRLVVLAALALGTLIAAIVERRAAHRRQRHLRHRPHRVRASPPQRRPRPHRPSRPREARPCGSDRLGRGSRPRSARARSTAGALRGPAAGDRALRRHGRPLRRRRAEYAEDEYAVEGEYAGAASRVRRGRGGVRGRSGTRDHGEIDLNALEQPALIDLTDAPTEELIAAQAS